MTRVHSWERTLRLLLLIAGDAAIAVLAVVAAVQFRRTIAVPGTEGLLPPDKFALDAVNLGIAAATLVLSLGASGFYAQRISARHRPMLAAALVGQIALLALVSTFIERPYPRTILLAQPLLESGLLIAWRRLFALLLPLRRRNTVLVGPAARVREFLARFDQQPDGRMRIDGWVDAGDGGASDAGRARHLGRLGEEAAERAICDAEEVIALSSDASTRLRLFGLRGAPGYLAVPSHADALIANPSLAWVGDQPLVEIAARSAFGSGRAQKRLLDVAVASVLLVALLPLMAAIALAVLVESGRPVLHVQRRYGRRGERFSILKFRTMYRSAESGGVLASQGDSRVTPVGRLLRRFRLDELPQLVNVLRGEMSLVGPRPEQVEIHERLSREVEGFSLRLLVQPGATGLAQICADYETPAATKLRYDLNYICAWSLWLDVRILLLSVSTTLSGRGL